MPKPRFSGGNVSMRCSSSQMLPSESGIRPAMQLSAVDLPQPEGPSSAMNSPRRIVSVMSDSALNALPPAPAKRRVTPVEPEFGEVVFHVAELSISCDACGRVAVIRRPGTAVSRNVQAAGIAALTRR